MHERCSFFCREGPSKLYMYICHRTHQRIYNRIEVKSKNSLYPIELNKDLLFIDLWTKMILNRNGKNSSHSLKLVTFLVL
jgi:hypothetical protein